MTTVARSFWVPEHPRFGGIYKSCIPVTISIRGIIETAHVTADIHRALQFDTREACEAWIAANPKPAFIAREHFVF